MPEIEREKEKSNAFYQGFAVAVADLARRGEPSVALDIMNCNGVTIRQLRDAGVIPFDLDPLEREAKL
jgi:hypothetical protein